MTDDQSKSSSVQRKDNRAFTIGAESMVGEFMEFEVNQKTGPYYSIQEAIDAAPSNSTIIIHSGLYSEQLKITKPNMKITSKGKQDSGDVILLSSQGSSILIDIPDNGRVEISNLKVTHTASSQEEELDPKSKIVGALAMGKAVLKYDDDDPQGWVFQQAINNGHVPNLVRVKQGKLIMKNCLLSLNFMQKSFDEGVPAVVMDPKSTAIFKNIIVKGNFLNPTYGFVINRANCIIEECRIQSHLLGGIIVNNTKNDHLTVNQSKFSDNGNLDMEITGQENACTVENCQFTGNLKNISIKVGIGAQPKIFQNIIKEYDTGIRVVSADAKILKNTISFCTNAIRTTTYKSLMNDTKIRLNKIVDNLENGIVVTGKNNNTSILQNISISGNRHAGVRLEDKADAKICFNRIFNNAHQGILLVENSIGYIEGNMIYHNIKANIALGGGLSENTVIAGNRIFESASEGIFMMLCGPCMIYNNHIYENYDGIVVLEGVPEISFNKIYKNKNNGMHVLRGSLMIMRGNRIFANEGIGLVLRDKSLGVIENNVIKDNQLELAVEFHIEGVQYLEDDNEIGQEVRLPEVSKCNLIQN